MVQDTKRRHGPQTRASCWMSREIGMLLVGGASVTDMQDGHAIMLINRVQRTLIARPDSVDRRFPLLPPFDLLHLLMTHGRRLQLVNRSNHSTLHCFGKCGSLPFGSVGVSNMARSHPRIFRKVASISSSGTMWVRPAFKSRTHSCPIR